MSWPCRLPRPGPAGPAGKPDLDLPDPPQRRPVRPGTTRTGRRGRPRTKCARLGTADDIAAAAAWDTVTVTAYGREHIKHVTAVSCLWCGSWHTRAVRLILARDEHTTSGYDLALITTDLTAAAAPPGSCRKPPGALYVERGREWVLSFALIVRCGRTTSSRSGGAPRTAVPSAQEALPRAYGCSRGTRSSPPSLARPDARVMRDQAASDGADTGDPDELAAELDGEITGAGMRGNVQPARPLRRNRTTRRRQDAAPLPRRKISPRTVGKTYTTPDGKRVPAVAARHADLHTTGSANTRLAAVGE